MNHDHPSGVVTFLFTDIEGSTKLWELYPEAMQNALARHDKILHHAIESNGGIYVKTTGDGCHAAFASAEEGILAASQAQREIFSEGWREIAPETLRVRMGLHSGEAEQREGDYFGPAVNRAARVMACAHGGQILLSNSTAQLADHELNKDLALFDLGEHRLKDLVRPERIYQLVVPTLPDRFPPIRSLDSFPNNLPVQLTSFIGRDRELAEATNLLDSTRLLTLIGSGGTGKTRFSLQMAADKLQAFADGAWLLELAPLSDPAQIVPTLAALFNLREVQGVPLLNVLRAYLRDKHLLVILDNCEHLVEACARLAEDLLRVCPKIKIIASSREGLGISGESIYRVPSLSLPEPSQDAAITPNKLLEYEAAQLFIERARAAHSHFAVNERNAPAIAQICQRLDGIPLALELAAARVAVFAPEQIATRLGDRFMILTGGSRTALPRQQTLRALIDWSYDLLTESEQTLLRRLSVFAGGWTLEVAEGVCSDLDVLTLLPQLVNKSLVMVDDSGSGRRFRLLETIRQYARDRLFEADEAIAARDQHLAYFLHFAEQAEIAMLGRDNVNWLQLLDANDDNLRAALTWGLEHHPEEALSLANHLRDYWSLYTENSPSIAWFETAIARVAALPPAQDEAARLRLRTRALGLANTSNLAISRGDANTACALSAEAVTLARQVGDPGVLSYGLGMYAMTSYFWRDRSDLPEVIDELISLGRQQDDKYYIGLALVTIARLEAVTSNTSRLQKILHEVQGLTKEIYGPRSFFLYYTLSEIARYGGHLEEGREYLKNCAAVLSQLNSKQAEAMIYSEMAHNARYAHDWELALGHYRDTIVRWKKLEHRAAVAHQLECIAYIAWAQCQPERATRLLGSAEALRDSIGAPMLDFEQVEYDAAIAALQAQLDSPTFESEWAAGRAMTMDEAILRAIE